jgi:PAS domain S-box-containing protein
MKGEVRELGLDVLDEAPWGTHLCQFYETKEDLIDALVPYFKTGLENNEFCMWVTAEPLGVDDAKASLGKAVENLEDYLAKSQIEILDYSQWYTRLGQFDANQVLQGWVEKLDQALQRGFDGLRLTGNTFWLENKDWDDFAAYEAMVDNVIGKYRILAICSYYLGKCGPRELIDVVKNHEFALVRRQGEWELFKSAGLSRADDTIERAYAELNQIFNTATDGMRVIDKDFNVLRYNQPFLSLSGITEAEPSRSKCYDAFSGPLCHTTDCPLKRIVAGEQRVECDLEKQRIDGSRIRCILTATPFVGIDGELIGIVEDFKDITERKRAEELLHQTERELRIRNQIAEIFLTTSDDEIYGDVLQVILGAMKSKYGTFAYINENGERVVPSMTRGIWDKCRIRQKNIVFPRDTWGNNLWARCLKEKRAISSNGPFKVPDGHIGITRALAVPIIHQGDVIGNFMVGNRATDYDERDAELLKTIADHTAPILHAWLQRARQEKERNRAQEALREAHDELEQRVEERTAELRRLSSQLIEVQERERKRIARELHDSIGQFLAAIKFGLENAINKMPKIRVEESLELFRGFIPLLQEASDEVRRIHTDLRPGLLDDLGIIATISWFCREFERMYSGLRIQKEIRIEEKAIPDRLKTVIFRILQEALHNIAKHAKAGLVRVALTKADDHIDFLLEDNGQGFDINQTLSSESFERGFGLTSMKERAELSGASFAIESVPGAGTKIRVSWSAGIPG